MKAKAVPPRWLIVVQRHKRDIYANLCESFELDERVDVILDRRQADRRGERVPVEPDQRQRERRTPPPGEELAFWENAGFCLIYERVTLGPKKRTGSRAGRRSGARARGRV